MITQPAYFEPTRRKAATRWAQLESDPELAAPWHQLFKQVQSPRHVLSELLQNADDAGATEANVRIEHGMFIFEHNGGDFSAEHFESLCRFGYSNKRALHTIGFRGIGFKSTFSLGPRVELFSPTLAVYFENNRFTEPHWHSLSLETFGKTVVRVHIDEPHVHEEIVKNLNEWAKSPVSLLFFKHLRRLQISDHDVHWGSLGPGPVAHSEWMARHGFEDQAYLLVRSHELTLPSTALAEIRQERMLGADDETEFPPAQVEIVLGASGRLYVVLPTGVHTSLPFACNAPFIQDPARLKIKDPDISPTNRWLLSRIGELAATTLVAWLHNVSLPVTERAEAYGLLPEISQAEASLENGSVGIVQEAMRNRLSGQPVLLTTAETVVKPLQSIVIPAELYEIWPVAQLSEYFDDQKRVPLLPTISPRHQANLQQWNYVTAIGKSHVIARLQQKRLPKPESWHKLLHLWAYVQSETTSQWGWYVTDQLKNIRENIKIIPVQGKDELYAPNEIVRLGDTRLLQSDDDWNFLADHMLVMNQNWPRFLGDQRRNAVERGDKPQQTKVNAAQMVLEQLRLTESSNIDVVIDRVASSFFTGGVSIQSCVQLTHIAAKLRVTAGSAFRFVNQQKHLVKISEDIVVDIDGQLERLLPMDVDQTNMLHPLYQAAFQSCTREEWVEWVHSGRAGLLTFAPIKEQKHTLYRPDQITQEAARRGLKGTLTPQYKSTTYRVEDWDFEESNWLHWEALEKTDPDVWSQIGARILEQRTELWSKVKSARILHVSMQSTTRSMTSEELLPGWVLRLRTKPCLKDTRGFSRRPDELLRRTQYTEAFLDVEPFIHAQYDTEANRPLLDLIGVQSTPTGPGRILDRLRALARSEKPPLYELGKWYDRLDTIIDGCSTADAQSIRDAFAHEKLIWSNDETWTTSGAVYLHVDEDDIPGIATIWQDVRHLALWHKVGVRERATVELVLNWLTALPSGNKLSVDEARRVRALMTRFPVRIWHQCGHWLSLEGEWVPVAHLRYGQSKVPAEAIRRLLPYVKAHTANLQGIDSETLSSAPFDRLPLLERTLEDRLENAGTASVRQLSMPWLRLAGSLLSRVQLDDVTETERIQALAQRLYQTQVQAIEQLVVTSYLDGVPASTPRPIEVLWSDTTLYITPMQKAKLAKLLPAYFAKDFGQPDIALALTYCYDRSQDDVRSYIEENFSLLPPAEMKLVPAADVPHTIEQPIGASMASNVNSMNPGPLESMEAPSVDTLADDRTVVEYEAACSSDEVATEVDSDDDLFDHDSTLERRRVRVGPSKPPLMERYAQGYGFTIQKGDALYHPDGRWLSRTHSERFPWALRSARGELLHYLWPKDHCLDREPIVLDADIWHLIEQRPQEYALILVDREDHPYELSGVRLRALRDDEKITLHPATYRLVYTHDHNIYEEAY